MRTWGADVAYGSIDFGKVEVSRDHVSESDKTGIPTNLGDEIVMAPQNIRNRAIEKLNFDKNEGLDNGDKLKK